MDGWKRIVSFWGQAYFQLRNVSFREWNYPKIIPKTWCDDLGNGPFSFFSPKYISSMNKLQFHEPNSRNFHPQTRVHRTGDCKVFALSLQAGTFCAAHAGGEPLETFIGVSKVFHGLVFMFDHCENPMEKTPVGCMLTDFHAVFLVFHQQLFPNLQRRNVDVWPLGLFI